MIRLVECGLQKLYMWHANLYSMLYTHTHTHTPFGLGPRVSDPYQIVCHNFWMIVYSQYVANFLVDLYEK